MTFVVDIVTGASQGIGRAIAEYIALQRSNQLLGHPYALALVGRSVERGSRAAAEISRSSGLDPSCVWFESCDLSDWKDVQRLKANILQRGAAPDFQVGVLVNDAAECPRAQVLVERLRKTSEGLSQEQVDKQFATNILGYHFMLKIFQEHFSSQVDLGSSPTHIVNVASNWAGNLDLNDLHFKRRRYDNDTAYRQSKQGDRMLTHVWSRVLQDSAVINSCHPGDPCTTLSKALGYNLGCAPPSQGLIRQTPIPFLCGLDDKAQVTSSGGWYHGQSCKPQGCQFEKMGKESDRLFEICDSFCHEV